MEPHKILGIKKDATEKEINKAYKKLAKEYHPDQSGKNTKLKFQKIQEAKEKMIKKEKALIKRKSAVTKTQVSNIIKEVMKHQPKKNLETKTKELIKSEKDKVKDKLRFPKISSSVIMVILTFIYFFPERLQNIPFFGTNFSYYVESGKFGMLWLILLLYFSMFWFFIWRYEKRHLQQINQIMSKENLGELYKETKRKFSKKAKFSKSTFEKLIEMPRIPFIQIKDKGEIADAILTEFLDRELIEKVKSKDMEDWYKL